MKYELKAPFPWFGGKRTVAAEVWNRFGDVRNYVEPFAGSLAVLLNRPSDPGTETVNDVDCYLSNFWRSLKSDPASVAEWADYPVNEADLHARHLWLVGRESFRGRMMSDPDYYDVKIAGWWVWGICQWIGSGWCSSKYYMSEQQLPHLGNAGRGIHCYLNLLAERLRSVRVACGNWDRVMGDSVTHRHGLTGVFLDPPYSHNERQDDLYANDNDISKDVYKWAIENGDNKKIRIAFCGYEGEHIFPDSWSAFRWKARGGYGSQGDGSGRENASRETIWFSPHCINTDAANLPLFAST